MVQLLKLAVLVLSVWGIKAGNVTFNSFESSSSISENTDTEVDLSSFTAMCHFQYNCNTTVPCNAPCNCTIPYSTLFSLSGDSSNYRLYKEACSDTSCGSYTGATPCLPSNGCANAGTVNVTVTCSGTHIGGDSASQNSIHTVTFTAESPTLDITNLNGSSSASRTNSTNDVIFTTSTTGGLSILVYEESTSVDNSLILGTVQLFRLNNATGEVYINSDPSNEFSSTYSMQICVYTRRQSNCGSLTITFSGCFQRPTCDDKSSTVADTFAIGDILFAMTVPNPTSPFNALSSTWQGLSFNIVNTTLSVATIDPSSGNVTINSSIIVFPSYPSKDYYIEVEVSNSDSCSYTSICNMNLTVTFTNYDISITNLDNSSSIHEDTDDLTLLLGLVISDDNDPDQDNVSCSIVTNPDSDMFIMLFDGHQTSGYEFNSSLIWKKECTDRGCGPVCAANTGCMNYDDIDQYLIVVECADAYDSTATGTLTVNVRENQPPVWTNLDTGCFQRPTCDDKSSTVADTFAIGDILFAMTVPNPTSPFNALSSTWQGLSFNIVNTTLSVATIDPSSGNVTINSSIIVFPSYPSKDYYIEVEVSNSDSCSYTSICNMNLTVTFTNYDISITNLDNSSSIHEDTDDLTLLLGLVISDDNDPDQDNVSCSIVTNPDSDMFIMLFDGHQTSGYEFNSSLIWKKECTDRGCGPVCAANTGCMNYDDIDQYLIVVECADAYDSTATGTLTVNVRENQPPVWTNLDKTITVNTDEVANLDVIYSFYYSDAEDETLNYNYTVDPSTTFFRFDSVGNFHNNVANITAVIHQWEHGNESYTLYTCGTERRNTICGTLTILQREFCGPSPTCTDATNTVSDQTLAGATLFTINVPPPATGSFSSLSYSIASENIALFSVDVSGTVTAVSALPITSPPNTTHYSITAYVYDSAACTIGTCHLGLDVTFTNLDISIDNMAGATANIHEDIVTQTTLLTISTSDANTVDGVNCVLDEANSVPANNGKFEVKETFTGSNVYEILNKAVPGFDFDAIDTYTVAVTCSDLYGSSDSATMTVTIDENQQPVLNNLPGGTSITVDPLTVFSGTSVFQLNATDPENDALTYFCNVTSTMVPLQCDGAGVVSLRRNVTISENGTSYSILMCITESVHSHVLCEYLAVTFVYSKHQPELSNLPATVYVNETTAAGAALFTVSVSDVDVGDTHTFTLGDVQPAGSSSKFTFNSGTGLLTLVSNLDYETQSTYNFTFSVEDAYLPGVSFKTLYLQVNDANEAPVLTLYTTSLSTTEGNTGQVIGTVLYSCSDIDAGQTPAVTLASGTHLSYFSMDSMDGTLTFAQNWDFESGGGGILPESTILGITCSDGQGLTDSGSLNVSVSPVNEFPPVLSISEVNLIIYSSQTLQHALFSVTATDSDFKDDGQFAFSIPGIGEGSQYFTVSSTGSVFISNYITWSYNHTFRFTVEVSDNETYPLTSHVDVTITYLSAVVQDAPSRPSKCLLCTTEGKLVFATIVGGSWLILVLLVHAVCRTRAWTLCQSEPVRLHERKTKQARRRRQREDIQKIIHGIEETDELSEEPSPNLSEPARLKFARPKQQPPKKTIYMRANDVYQAPEGTQNATTAIDSPVMPGYPSTNPAPVSAYHNTRRPIKELQRPDIQGNTNRPINELKETRILRGAEVSRPPKRDIHGNPRPTLPDRLFKPTQFSGTG